MTSSAQSYCQNCKLEGKAVVECLVRKYQYKALLKKCPKESGQPEVPSTTFRVVPVADLFGAPFPSRLDPEDPELAELVDSIKTYGVLEPILVRSKPSGILEVVAGERRLRAAKKAGIPVVPVLIKTLSDEQAFILQLTENLQRRDLTEEEKSRGLGELARRTKWNAQQIADKLKMSYQWVMKYLPDEFKEKSWDREPSEPILQRRIEHETVKASITTEQPQVGFESAPQEVQRAAEVQRNPRWNEPSIPQPAVTTSIPISPEETHLPTREPITTSIPSVPKAPEPPAPKPEFVDIGEFECSECHQKFHVKHLARNLHRLELVREA